VQRVAAGSGDPVPADENSKREEPETSREIVLADWSPPALSLESPAEIERAIRHLCNLARYRRLDLSSVSIWTLANADLEGIRFAIEQREEKWVRDAILDSLEENMQSVNRPHGVRTQRDEQLDLATATERLSEELLKNGSDESSRRRLRDAESNYRRLAVAEVVKPLLQEAQAAIDPVERMRQLQLAHLANMFLMKFPGVLREEVGGTAAEAPGRQQQRATGELLMTSKQITVLAGEQIRCKQFQKTRLRTARPRTIDAPPLRNLGSTTKS
jgi:ribosomal protein S15P/S13E